MDKYREILNALATFEGESVYITVKAPDFDEDDNVVEFALDPDEARDAYIALDELVSEHEG